MSAPRLRVATFNIHHGVASDGTLNLAETARVLHDLDADVIALQEVDRFFSERSEFVDQAAFLADHLDMHAEFAPLIDLEPSAHSAERIGLNSRRQYGIALLTRLPIGEARMARLPERREVERRGVLVADLEVDGVRVSVGATHLATGPGRVRRRQFEAAREMACPKKGPGILMGDLNSPSFHPRDYRLFTSELTDAWKAAHSPLRRVLTGRTHPSAPLPLRRIDYILATKDIRPLTCRVVKTAASDHLPVVADLELPAPRT